ncbi:S-adenosyl-L-methionine-dependent methyltransferase, partial [Staphylotrichum tortipilum]
MPRLPPSLFWRARRDISPLAPTLLPACRDLESASNELRWIREHVRAHPSSVPAALRVWALVRKRGTGVPLQYVLGTQPFGPLEIRCKPGVLIPRPETEAYTLHLATLLPRTTPTTPLTILDLCTGTGCIPLLLLHTHPGPLTLHALDISPSSISLARLNHRLHPSPSPSSTLTFHLADIFSPSPCSFPLPPNGEVDLLTSNPPYISPHHYSHTTARSVRNHEPRLALVPPEHIHTADLARGGQRCRQDDVFYARLLDLAETTRAKRVFFEVGGVQQARRVVEMVLERAEGEGEKGYGTVEIWRDEPGAGERGERVVVGGREVV